MINSEVQNEINRLNLEDYVWVIFIIISLANIYGDKLEKDYLRTNNKKFEDNANVIFEIVLLVTFLIYIYFWVRNYKAFAKACANEKRLYIIKLLGSSFLIAGVLCLLYFQTKNSNFIGGPAV